MAVVTVSEVLQSTSSEDALAAFELEQPVAGGQSDVYALVLRGSAAGMRSPVTRIDRRAGARVYPGVPVCESRFDTRMGVLSLPQRFELELRAALEDGASASAATIRGERSPLPRADHQGAQPLMITGLGRSGSTWFTDLLGQHPEILSVHPYSYEPRACSYWMDVLVALTEPSSYSQMLAPAPGASPWWVGVERKAWPFGVDTQTEQWLGKEHVEDLARFCRERIDSFYSQTSKNRFSFFAEKMYQYTPQTLLREIYPGAREIFLVRDFRDVACSVFAYTRQQEAEAFGRASRASDEEYISGPLLHQVRELLMSWRLRGDDSYLVRYEELVLDTESSLESLLSYLEIDAGSDILKRMVASAAAGGSHRTTPAPEASVGRWRNELDDAQCGAFDDRFREAFETFGYVATIP